MMKIIVPVKQVPETGNVKIDDKTGTIIREGVETIVNPLDLYAIETAIQIKEKYGGSITVLSMGPASAEKSLREAISMGCDNGILLTGNEFAGSDTWATSLALSKAIEKLKNYDLIITGERATDGETGQVGPEIASILDIPLGAYTSRIVDINKNSITIERLTEEGYETLKIKLPALLTVVKEIGSPRLPTLKGKKLAKKIPIDHWSARDILLSTDKTGLKGSPTRVAKIYKPSISRNTRLLRALNDRELEIAIGEIISFLKQRNLL